MSNTQQSSKLLFDYVYLAEASYADFSDAESAEEFKDAIVDTKVDKDTGEGKKKPESFAEMVIDNYAVVAHWKDRIEESSFSGTLFKSIGDGGRYVLAFKGTDGLKDLLAVDVADYFIQVFH